MRRRILAAVTMAVLALGACDKGKPRRPPVDDMAAAPPPPGAAAAPSEGLSGGLEKRAEPPTFSLDRVGSALDPLNRQPAVTPAARPIVFQGFGFDPVAKAAGRGVDVVVDDKVYGAAYGADRPDVARYFKAPGLAPVGFSLTLPAGALASGPHMAQVRVVAADGKGYFDSHKLAFEVK